jgi:3-oxoacyl-[acyl-carrier-protein] synthase III
MPPLPFVKNKRYAKKKEIRFCMQLFGDPAGAIILNSLDAWHHYKVLKSISAQRARLANFMATAVCHAIRKCLSATNLYANVCIVWQT